VRGRRKGKKKKEGGYLGRGPGVEHTQFHGGVNGVARTRVVGRGELSDSFGNLFDKKNGAGVEVSRAGLDSHSDKIEESGGGESVRRVASLSP